MTRVSIGAGSWPSAMDLSPPLMPAGPRTRDARVDVLRGLALLMIFVDHIPGDVLNVVTLHNFGFCDAAEIFVTLAGFSSMMAYGSKFDRKGLAMATLRRIAARCLRIYVVQAVLLLITLIVVWRWTEHYQLPAMALEPWLEEGLEGLFLALTLRALPGYIDILPLYIVLLASFPLIYFVMRRNIRLALTISAGLWVAANLDHSLNLPNAMDGKGWYFNPFTWQLLFTIGAALAVLMAREGGSGQAGAAPGLLPQRWWLTAACWAYLGFAFLQGASWADWGLPSLRPLHMATPDKSLLSPLRILDILALLYLFLSSRAVTVLLRNPAAKLVATCGRHSLEVFAVGCICALAGRLLMRIHGSGAWMQVGINGLGIGAMCTIALILEHNRKKKVAAARAAVARPQDGAFQEGDFRVYRPS